MDTSEVPQVIDYFAGTGWGVACKWLKLNEDGVEIMPEAVATREANGMRTIYRDVWDGLRLTKEEHAARYGAHFLAVFSPPCQTFSIAGGGAGRAALDEVLEAIELHAYKDVDALIEFGERHDPRTALVLSPLAVVWRDRPLLVVMEQVPTVLPVWEAFAEVMRDWGYSVQVEVLNAEQYGVPQTRKRAILVARLGGPARLPVPTHSRYYSNNPARLDPGVKKWVSMAEALGWGALSRPVAATKPQTKGRTENYGTRPDRPVEAPSFTVVGHDGHPRGGFEWRNDDGSTRRATPEELAALQSYPSAGIVFRNGNQANSAKRPLDAPAPTIHFGARSNKVEWIDAEVASDPAASGVRVSVDEASALQSYPSALRSNYGTGGDAANRGLRPVDAPAFTLTSKADRNKWDGDRPLSLEEASALQSYEPPFVWCGSKSKQFLQIGNAVPPLLAEAVLAALLGLRAGR